MAHLKAMLAIDIHGDIDKNIREYVEEALEREGWHKCNYADTTWVKKGLYLTLVDENNFTDKFKNYFLHLFNDIEFEKICKRNKLKSLDDIITGVIQYGDLAQAEFQLYEYGKDFICTSLA